VLDLPEAGLHRLFVWAHPKVRTKRAALAALPTARSFKPSPQLFRFAEIVDADTRIAIDLATIATPDRFLLLAVRRDDFDSVITWIAQQCRELGLVLFDPEGERLVVPTASRGESSYRESDLLAKVRVVLQSVRLSGDRQDDARELTIQALNVTGGQLAGESMLPGRVRGPFEVPTSLRFLMPDLVPDRRQTKAGQARYLKDLRVARSQTRRAAAWDLGGWQPSEKVDDRLRALLEGEPDMYARAVVALSLALRGTTSSEAIVRCAQDVAANAETNADQPFATLAASVALLAASIAVVRASSDAGCDECLELAGRVARLPGEGVRAEALSNVLREHCHAPR
jgi:hypothetical protein